MLIPLQPAMGLIPLTFWFWGQISAFLSRSIIQLFFPSSSSFLATLAHTNSIIETAVRSYSGLRGSHLYLSPYYNKCNIPTAAWQKLFLPRSYPSSVGRLWRNVHAYSSGDLKHTTFEYSIWRLGCCGRGHSFGWLAGWLAGWLGSQWRVGARGIYM